MSADETATKRTDARKFKIVSDLQSGTREVVDVDLAEDLESTLAETQERLTALREAVAAYLNEPSIDGRPIRQEMRGNLRLLVSPPITALRNAADSTKGEQ